jgi:hypothetical protein
LLHTIGSLATDVWQGLEALRAAGLPAFSVWMFDEAWALARSVWPHAERLLGGRCLLEPTVAAYHLDHGSATRVRRPAQQPAHTAVESASPPTPPEPRL